MYCWGYNSDGELGIGNTTQQNLPIKVNTTRKFSSLSLGQYHTCGIEQNTNDMYCWGYNQYGQLGTCNTTQQNLPIKVNTTRKFSSLSLGLYNTCGIEQNTNDIYCWGYNNYGQLGTGNTNNQSLPIKVNTTRKFSYLYLGQYHTCGIEQNTNDMYCWGYNNYGQLGNGNITNQYLPTKVNTIRKFSSLSLGIFHTCGIEQNTNNMYCWGHNYYGQLGNGNTTQQNLPTKVEYLINETEITCESGFTLDKNDISNIRCYTDATLE